MCEAATATSLSRGPRLDSGMESRAMPQGCGDYGFDPIGECRHRAICVRPCLSGLKRALGADSPFGN
jgi:hypothetical protein